MSLQKTVYMDHHATCRVTVPTMPLVILSMVLVPVVVNMDCWTGKLTTGQDLPVKRVSFVSVALCTLL
jgi:hypothetical protein